MFIKPKVYREGPHDWVAELSGGLLFYHTPTWSAALAYALHWVEQMYHVRDTLNTSTPGLPLPGVDITRGRP